jgi:3-oxo-5alpha-steroid 4-dehydrogenase
MQRMIEAVERTPVRIEVDVLAETLVVEPDGSVVGLVARRAGRELTVRARRGVVLAAGGFVLDDEMLAQHCPQAARCEWRLSAGGDDGRAIKMGIGVGGHGIRMDAAECAIPLTPPRRLVRGVLVNRFGQRFINEDTYYGRIGQASLFHQDGTMFFIHDDETYEVNDTGFEASWVGDTIEELEREMSLPEGSLQATIELYNRHAERGEDPVFHKGREFLKPLVTPPFGAIDCSTNRVLYATFTLGGLRTRPSGAVLTPDGREIPGLHAAGRTTAGVAAFGYASGVSLADGSFFGRLAGRSAAVG